MGPMERIFGDASLKREFGVAVFCVWVGSLFTDPPLATELAWPVLTFLAAVTGIGQWTRHKEKLNAQRSPVEG